MLREKSMSNPLSEAEFVDMISSFLTKEGYNVICEVPNMGQSADMVARRNRWLTVIEAKLKDWRRAIQQCLAHEMVADYICVAYCSCSVSELLLNELDRRGYGLIHFSKTDNSLQWIVHPRKNNNVWYPQRKQFISSIRSIENDR